jgi:hypothetical protein
LLWLDTDGAVETTGEFYSQWIYVGTYLATLVLAGTALGIGFSQGFRGGLVGVIAGAIVMFLATMAVVLIITGMRSGL